jgi:YggT family protein
MLDAIASIYLLIWYMVICIITFTIVLMLMRIVMNSFDVNPFTWPAMTARRLSDPFIDPVKRGMRNVGLQPKYAPLITILLVILVGWFALQLVAGVLNTVAGVLVAAKASAIIAVIGYVLYGLLALYGLLIFIRIIFSWGSIRHSNRVMRLLVKITDPLLVPLRRMIPPVGMFDISPIVAFIIVWLLQAAVQGTLLRGWLVRFFD